MSSHESRSGDAAPATPIPRLPAGSRLYRYEQQLDTWWQDQMLSTLIAALNMHDGGTADHSARVASLVVDLAKEAGYAADSPELEEVRRGALLHDIGKLGVDTAILQNPGSLSDDEWQAMETHPALGYLMLKEIPPLLGTVEMVYASHERWDGGGYPRRLEGDQIPEGAFLLSLADGWDAMISDRPYCKALSFDAALQKVHDNAGTHFDPMVVAAFDRVITQRGGRWEAGEPQAAA
jgi:putative nucleotidyltransferase with HDIG domain